MRSFFVTWWSLADALDWRCGFEPRISTEGAFAELRELCLAGRVKAIGIPCPDHPLSVQRIIELVAIGYRPFLDPPRPREHEDIPAGEWAILFPLDRRLYWTSTRLPAWSDVELDKGALVSAWLPIAERAKTVVAAGTQSDYEIRVEEFRKAHQDRNPPIQSTKVGLQGDREWATENRISRADITRWRRAVLGEQKGGRPKNSTGNSAKK
jgi:hypothetical protein